MRQDNTHFSLVDLTISLMIVFILLFIMAMNKLHQDYVKSTQKTRENLVSDLQTKKINAGTDNKDPLSVNFSLANDKIKFKKNRYFLLPEGEEFLNTFIPEFASTICDEEMYKKIQSVQIIGHTDSDASDEHNLELSQQRALSVMIYALNKTSLTEEQRDCLLNLISINGRGKRELIFNEDGTEDMDSSRRVEFKIRVKSFEEQRQIANDSKESITEAIEETKPEENTDTDVTEPSDEKETNLQEEQQTQESQEQTEPEEIYEDDYSSQPEQYGQERFLPDYEDITALSPEDTAGQENKQEENEIPVEDPSLPVLEDDGSGQIISTEQ